MSTHSLSEHAVHLILKAYLMNERRLELRDEDLTDPRVQATLRREAAARPTFVALAALEPLQEGRVPAVADSFAAGERVLSCFKAGGELALEVYRLRPRPEAAPGSAEAKAVTSP